MTKCVVCDRTVRRRQQALDCGLCGSWTHRICFTGIFVCRQSRINFKTLGAKNQNIALTSRKNRLYRYTVLFHRLWFFTGITKAQYLAAAKKGTSLWFVCVNCQERSHRSTDHTENNDSEDDEDDVCFFVSSQFVVILLND